MPVILRQGVNRYQLAGIGQLGPQRRPKVIVLGRAIPGELSPRADRPVTVRWVPLHLTGKIARHNGHIDILRELADGARGLRSADYASPGTGKDNGGIARSPIPADNGPPRPGAAPVCSSPGKD
jgi:hypothetical protein